MSNSMSSTMSNSMSATLSATLTATLSTSMVNNGLNEVEPNLSYQNQDIQNFRIYRLILSHIPTILKTWMLRFFAHPRHAMVCKEHLTVVNGDNKNRLFEKVSTDGEHCPARTTSVTTNQPPPSHLLPPSPSTFFKPGFLIPHNSHLLFPPPLIHRGGPGRLKADQSYIYI